MVGKIEGVQSLATVKVYDRADEFRIELIGRFAGDCVEEIANTWKSALTETSPRRFTVDISRLSSYDAAGRTLLHEMQQHGMQFAAGTPQSLVFLGEISTPLRRGPALLREAVPLRKTSEPTKTALLRAVAAGE